jgi:nucleoside-diphosphate-sugar epimerase
MARFLVTGATGFIGQHLIAHLLAAQHSVRRALRRPAHAVAGVHDVLVGEVDDQTDWRHALETVDVVVHLAARVHVFREVAPDPLEANRKINVRGTACLARAAATAGISRFVLLSSAGVHGLSAEPTVFTEGSPPAPHTAYAQSKWEGEQGLHEVAAETGLLACVLRPPLVYGPGDLGNFMRLVRLVDRRVPLPLSAVRNRRSLLFVGNLCSAILACAMHASANGRTYLVRDGQDMSTSDLIRLIAKGLGGKPVRLFPCPPGVLRAGAALLGRSAAMTALLASQALDDTAIRDELGWFPPWSLEQGLAVTLEWYRAGSHRAGIAAQLSRRA